MTKGIDVNVFVIEHTPELSAASQCDKHVVKMTLETAQILCSAIRLHDDEGIYDSDLYKLSHKNHPVTKWASLNRGNFDWLVRHGIALSDEYTARYGKIHKSTEKIILCNKLRKVIPDGKMTKHCLAMPDEYKVDCVVESYRNYYRAEKQFFSIRGKVIPATWKRNKPNWL